jgi:TolB-like protein
MRNLMRCGFRLYPALLWIVVPSFIVFQEVAGAFAGMEGKAGVDEPRAQYTLAVLPLEATGRVSAEEAVALTGALRTELEKTGIFTVTDQNTVDAALQSAGLLETGCSTVECGVQAGKLLSTQLVVNGNIRKVGQLFFVEIQMLHVNSGQVVQKVDDDFDGDLQRLQSYMRVVARKLVGKSSGSAKAVSVTPPPQELTATEQTAVTPEQGEMETKSAGGEEQTASTGQVKRGSNKLLVFGLVAAGAVGAGVLISQAGKDNKDNKSNTSTDLPNPPKFP